jgi:hypothetical protein
MGRVRELEVTMSRINKDCRLSLSHEMGCPLLDKVECQRRMIGEMKRALKRAVVEIDDLYKDQSGVGAEYCGVYMSAMEALHAAEELEEEK